MKSIKNLLCVVLIGIAGTVGIANSVNAAEPVLNGEIGVVSRDIYRGVETGDQVSLYADGRLSNLFVDGLFVDGSFNTIVDENGRARVGVGYGLTHGNLVWEVSASRNFWADQFNVPDYTEYTGRVGYNIFNISRVYGEVTYAPNVVTNLDVTYAQVGIDFMVTDNFTVCAAVSGYNYDGNGYSDTKYHNTAVTASYNVWDKFDVFGQYSFGGDLPAGLGTLENASNVGVRYRF